MPPFIKFTIIGQIRFDGNTQNPASVDNNSTVKKPAINLQWRTRYNNCFDFFRSFFDCSDAFPNALQKGILVEQIFIGISR